MGAEKVFENKIKAYLKEKGVWYVKYFANAYTKKGVPDILACANGHFLAIEVKAEDGRPSALQLRNIDDIRKAGGTSLILKPSEFDDFKVLLESLLV